jgi:indole-3-glycerol phosphate synthase
MNILDKIVEEKKLEVKEKKLLFPAKMLEKSLSFGNKNISLKESVLSDDKFGVIAEFKRKSPSKGIINEYASVEKVSIGYIQAGASALSILTDEKFFGGLMSDLTIARKFNFCPILRKDFIIDEYQIVEAKSIGADAILLIAAILNPCELQTLAKFAKSLGLEVLLELHDESEFNHINPYIDLVGINNRNLKDFSVNVNKSIQMAQSIPDEFIKIAESGISDIDTLLEFKKNGFNGFLMGELFMSSPEPEITCKNFIQDIKKALQII